MISLFALTAYAADDAPSHLDQARLFFKRGWYADAEAELDAARAVGGDLSREINALLAQVRWQRCDVPGARAAAAEALRLSVTADEIDTASAFVEFLDRSLGRVDVRTRQAGVRGRIAIDPVDPVYDPELQAYVGRIDALYDAPTDLPLTLHLPVGRWRIGGHDVAIAPVGAQTVTLDVAEAAGVWGGLVQSIEVDLGVGFGAWFGAAVAGQLPAPSFEAALRVPVGPVFAAGVFDIEPRRYTRSDGSFAPAVTAGMVGGKLGFEVPGSSPLTPRAALGYRVGTVAGVSTETIEPTLGLAHVPYLELSLTDFTRQRNKGVGFGVTVTGERAFGTVAASSGVGYSDDDLHWSATGARLLFHVALAP